MQVHTNLSARLTKYKGEINKKESETIPDQAVTPQELLHRFATGQPLGFQNVTPVYDDDDIEIPELYKMNKMDKLHALEKSSENYIEKRTDYINAVHKYRKQQAEKLKKETETTDKKTETPKPAKETQ